MCLCEYAFTPGNFSKVKAFLFVQWERRTGSQGAEHSIHKISSILGVSVEKEEGTVNKSARRTIIMFMVIMVMINTLTVFN